MKPGDTVCWYSVHGWRYGILVTLGRKWARVRRAGSVVRIEREKLRPR